jgi:signal transduction histidine kinase
MSDNSGAHRAIDPPPATSGVPRDTDLTRLSRHLAVGEFAASMAHEMRQPLTAIIGNAQTCLRLLGAASPDVEEIKAALADIVAAGDRAGQLLQRNRELLSPQPSNPTALDVNDVVREVASMARAHLQVSGVRLSLSLHDLPAVNADRRELQHVLLNLITNAIDATAGRDIIERALEIDTDLTAEGLIQVAVADTGVGVDTIDLERIFTPFYTTKTSALGVGLPISRSIIERHGGTLWAEPREGRGARFCFTLPKSAAAVAGTHAYP